MIGYHKLVGAFFDSDFNRLLPKTVYYRNYKNFNQESFLKSELESNNPNGNYRFITETFIEIVKRNVTLKKRFIRKSQVPFMNNELKKRNLQQE